MCNGLVFYMKKVGEKNADNDFYDAIAIAEYTANNANNTGHIKCGKKNFEDINPVPGEDK